MIAGFISLSRPRRASRAPDPGKQKLYRPGQDIRNRPSELAPGVSIEGTKISKINPAK